MFEGEDSSSFGRGPQRRPDTRDPGGNKDISDGCILNICCIQVVFDENNGALVLIGGKLDIQDSLKDEKYVKSI